MNRLNTLLTVVAVAVLVWAGIAAASQQRSAFPHLQHERLFPVCEGCHIGVVSGSESELYPAAASCASCHDGTREDRVDYTPPPKRASNLRFSHVLHDSTTPAGTEASCQSCHASPAGAQTRMNVAGPQPESCIGCHAHRAEVHLAPNVVCSQCHVPLARATTLSQERVAGFPRPEWHDTDDFLSTHGRNVEVGTASCSTCHARQTCERCHANAAQVPLIASISRDARVASIETGKKSEYPLPASHRTPEWATAHGVTALAEGATCANCHTQPSCNSCHMNASGTAGNAIASLPKREPRSAPGVVRTSVSGVHPADFAVRHGIEASAGTLQCTQCHSVKTCASCHIGMDSRAFHKPNFVERHAVEVFSGSGSCQSCHSTETFCRACHQQVGIASTSNMNSAFHTAQPMWILSHGQAARTGMESCAACHKQSDCVQCHSAVGGWRVNPHGPGFPASRLAARNAASCRWCHTVNGGRGE